MVQDDPERKLDVWLDEALARYRAPEPRPGLERRVLERLRTEKQGLPPRGWKAWAPALAAAAAIIVLVVMLRNRDLSPERTVSPENGPAQDPAAHAETAEERQPVESLAKPGKANPQESRESLRRPETGAASALPPSRGATHGAGAASRASNPHSESVFPAPAPLSEQERLAMAALRSGLLSSETSRIPPGDEPLPQVVIQEIEIKPLQEIKPIGREGA